MSDWYYEFKQALSRLKEVPGFAISVITTMGFTLGLLLCVITLNHLLLSEPLPYPDQNDIYVTEYLKVDRDNTAVSNSFDYDALLEMYKKQVSLSSASIIHFSWNLIENHPSQPLVNTIATTPEYFELFDVPIIIGRGFEESESIDLKNPVIIISYQLWQEYYGGRRDVIGQKAVLGDFSYKIIGVIAEGFIEPQLYELGRITDVWLPWDVIGTFDEEGATGYPMVEFSFVGKLGQENSVHQIEHIESNRMNNFWRAQAKYNELEEKSTVKIKLISVKNAIIGNTESIGLMLLAVAIGLILIASTNITNLFVSRLAEQQKQLSIRAAIGARKYHLFFQIFSESIILMFATSIVALLFASLGFEFMKAYFSTLLPRSDELNLNMITWVSAISLLFIFALVFSIISTRLINYRSLNSMFLSGGKGVAFQVSKKIRYILITIQVSVATFLVFINLGLFQQAAEPLLRPKGVELDDIFKLYLVPHSLPFESAATRIALTKEIKRKLSELPVVESTSHSHYPILSATLKSKQIGTTSGDTINAFTRRVDQDYFSMLNQRLLEGNNFTYIDVQNRNRELTGEVVRNQDEVAIVNQTFAAKLRDNKNSEALGELIRINGGEPLRIIGIVEDSVNTSSLVNEAIVYSPTTEAGFTYLIKFKEGQSLTRKALVSLIKSTTSLYAPYEYSAVSDDMDKLMFAHTTVAIVTSILSLVVLFLAGLGIYGVLSYSIQIRRFEIGIRLAVGAKRRSLIGLIIKDNAMPILIAVTVSLIGLLLLFLRFSEQFSEHTDIQLSSAFAMTLLLVGGVSFLSCYVRLRRYINRPVIFSLRG